MRSPMAWLLPICVLVALCGVAGARPGGGHSFSSGGGHSYSGGGHSYSGGSHSYSGGSHSYSGGSHSYSGGSSYGGSGGGGDGALGIIFVMALLILVVIVIIAAMNGESNDDSYTSEPTPPEPPSALDLTALTDADPEFSRVMFEDFAYQLYSAARRADRDELMKLAPYLSDPVITKLLRRTNRVEQVVIGTLRIKSATRKDGAPRVIVGIEANLSNQSGTTYIVEQWVFVRAAGVKTKPLQLGTRSWPCPNCGAAWVAGDDPRKCSHCGETIDAGRFDWVVSDTYVENETSVGVTLTGTTEEIGNDFPTIETDDPAAALMKLRTDDPEVSWDAFSERVKFVYAQLNQAWNAQDLTAVRGLVTQSLLGYLRYWIDEYKRQNLVNHLDDAKVNHVRLAAVTRDPSFDAITVRVYADGLDYTQRGEGAVVGGSRTDRRAYTEYWTFVRSAKRRGKLMVSPSCPNCGAPLAISDAGTCTHCNVQVENGDFDFVLSKIEQDDVYAG